jgi:type VI protein secretion system component Hcp
MPLDGFLELKRGGAAAVEGECRDATFSVKKAMAIKSFEFGSETSSSKSDEEGDEDEDSGKIKPPQKKSSSAHPNEFKFSVTKDVDAASPQLFVAYCQHAAAIAKPFDTAIVTLRKAQGSERMIYLVMEFSGVFVSSYSINGASGDKLPEETLEFTFQNSVRYRYYPQTSAGHGAANIKGWNKKTNVPI